MKIARQACIFLLVVTACAGCTTFHETGKDLKEAGGNIKDDFSKAGPAIKEDFKKVGPAMKEGFCEMGHDMKKAAGEAKESLEETFK